MAAPAPGDLGVLPVVVALVRSGSCSRRRQPALPSAENLVNLTLQSAPVGVIALGVVLVLLVGQIDLSVGAVSRARGGRRRRRLRDPGLAVWLAILAALACGVVVGPVYGALSTRLGLPSFVFTLAGLLFLAGVQLRVLGPTGSINLPFESWFVRFVQTAFLAPATSWVLVAVVVVASAALQVTARVRRGARTCLSRPPAADRRPRRRARRAAVGDRGLPRHHARHRPVFALFVVLVVVTDVLLRRTRWGRSVRAVGGDAGRRARGRARAAHRRAVLRGLLDPRRARRCARRGPAGRANQGTGGADTYLVAIAAAVIGGTSLFGGRGSAWSAVLGVLVIQSIANGLTLMNVDQAARLVVTGVVLAVAVTIDALQRRAREA